MARRRTGESSRLLKRARRLIPGGVNSAVRAYGAVGGIPPFIARGKGCRVWDADGNEYIDYVGSWGPLILGHANPRVLRAVRDAMRDGTSFGAPTQLEVDMAERVRRVLPSIERLRMVSSGTEATMSAIRLARGATGRSHILKFDGCYHGHSDGLLVGAGSGVATLGIPGSPGVPKEITKLTVQAPFNDLAAARRAFERWGDRLACVILEPIAGNMGFIRPADGFLEGLRALCDDAGALLIIDEVMTGFRVARGGAQRLFDVTPDLTTVGKVVGGGLPAAGFGGRGELMDQIAPVGPVFHAGTLSGNPLAMAAGVATLDALEAPGAYDKLGRTSQRLCEGLAGIADEAGLPFCHDHQGGMFGFFFAEGPIRNFDDAKRGEGELFRRFFASMLDEGVYLAPSSYEAGFVSLAHRPADIDQTLEAARVAMRRAAKAI